MRLDLARPSTHAVQVVHQGMVYLDLVEREGRLDKRREVGVPTPQALPARRAVHTDPLLPLRG